MRAAAATFRGKRPPPELELMTLCETFSCTPSQILEEDYHLLRRMILASNVRYTIRTMTRATGEKIHSVSPEVAKFGQALKKMGLY